MSKWKITSTHDLPAELVELGFSRSIVIECETVHLPLDEQRRQGDATAHFNGFEIVLHAGDKVEQVA